MTVSKLSAAAALAVGLLTAASGLFAGGAPGDALRAELIGYSASDWRKHPPSPTAFRNVSLRYLEAENGGRVDMLCGEYRVAGKDGPEWARFVTIKTKPYEQWLGVQAEGHCSKALPTEDSQSDATQELLDAIKGT